MTKKPAPEPSANDFLHQAMKRLDQGETGEVVEDEAPPPTPTPKTPRPARPATRPVVATHPRWVRPRGIPVAPSLFTGVSPTPAEERDPPPPAAGRSAPERRPANGSAARSRSPEPEPEDEDLDDEDEDEDADEDEDVVEEVPANALVGEDEDGIVLSKDLRIPIGMVTESIAVVAQRGSGKTYLTIVMTEEMLEYELPFVVIDPLGVFWGLRSSEDGEKEGYAVPILGGLHGDMPLDPGSGRAIARWILEQKKQVVLDLFSMRAAEQRVFVADFAEELYERCREPIHVIVDEADMFIPQNPQPDQKRVLFAFEDLVRRGRVRGIGITVVTQRPAVIHKDILTQVGTLVMMRLLAPHDRKAVHEWIRFHGDPSKTAAVLNSLASLPRGTAWVWSPGWLGILKKIAVRVRRTFDSSRTPVPNEVVVVPRVRAFVDPEVLQASLGETLRSDPNDPRAMRLKIAELERALQMNVGGEASAMIQRLEKRNHDLELELLTRSTKGGKPILMDPGLISELVLRNRTLTNATEELVAKVTVLIDEVADGDVVEEGEEGEEEDEKPEEEPLPPPEPTKKRKKS